MACSVVVNLVFPIPPTYVVHRLHPVNSACNYVCTYIRPMKILCSIDCVLKLTPCLCF